MSIKRMGQIVERPRATIARAMYVDIDKALSTMGMAVG